MPQPSFWVQDWAVPLSSRYGSDAQKCISVNGMVRRGSLEVVEFEEGGNP